MIEIFENERLISMPKGQIMLYPGDTVDYFYIIKTGLVKVFTIDDDGNEFIVMFLKPNMILPTFAHMFNRRNYIIRYFHSAFTDVQVYKISREDFLTKLDSDYLIMKQMTETILETKTCLLHHIESIQVKTAQGKVKHTLNYLNELTKDLQEPVKFTQQDIASVTGLTRETVGGILSNEART